MQDDNRKYGDTYSAAIQARFIQLFEMNADKLDAAKTPEDYWAILGDYVKLECYMHAKELVSLSMDGVMQVAEDYKVGPFYDGGHDDHNDDVEAFAAMIGQYL